MRKLILICAVAGLVAAPVSLALDRTQSRALVRVAVKLSGLSERRRAARGRAARPLRGAPDRSRRPRVSPSVRAYDRRVYRALGLASAPGVLRPTLLAVRAGRGLRPAHEDGVYASGSNSSAGALPPSVRRWRISTSASAASTAFPVATRSSRPRPRSRATPSSPRAPCSVRVGRSAGAPGWPGFSSSSAASPSRSACASSPTSETSAARPSRSAHSGACPRRPSRCSTSTSTSSVSPRCRSRSRGDRRRPEAARGRDLRRARRACAARRVRSPQARPGRHRLGRWTHGPLHAAPAGRPSRRVDLGHGARRRPVGRRRRPVRPGRLRVRRHPPRAGRRAAGEQVPRAVAFARSGRRTTLVVGADPGRADALARAIARP